MTLMETGYQLVWQPRYDAIRQFPKGLPLNATITSPSRRPARRAGLPASMPATIHLDRPLTDGIARRAGGLARSDPQPNPTPPNPPFLYQPARNEFAVLLAMAKQMPCAGRDDCECFTR